MPPFLGKLLVCALGLIWLAVVVSLGTVLLQTWRQYRTFEARAAETEAHVQALREEFAYKEEYLRLVLSDRDFLEKVVRDRLGYVRPDETIFRFEQ